MRVKKESPVTDQESFLYQWDSAARKYFEHFDILLDNQRHALQKNFSNVFSGWRDASRYFPTFHKIDMLVHKQTLGDISKQEVKEVNSNTKSRYYFTKSWSQPATMFAWDSYIAASWALGAGSAVFGKFLKGYSIVWLAIPFAPCWIHLAYNYRNQPMQNLDNAYRYLIDKRAATVEYELNKSKVEAEFSKYAKQRDELKNYLQQNNMTLYDFEAAVYEKMTKGSLK